MRETRLGLLTSHPHLQIFASGSHLAVILSRLAPFEFPLSHPLEPPFLPFSFFFPFPDCTYRTNTLIYLPTSAPQVNSFRRLPTLYASFVPRSTPCSQQSAEITISHLNSREENLNDASKKQLHSFSSYLARRLWSGLQRPPPLRHLLFHLSLDR